MKAKKRPFAWSYSRYSCFKECPARYKYSYIDKLPDIKNKWAQRGIDIHEKAEKFLDGRIKSLPKELEKLGDKFKYLKKIQAVPEQAWSLTSNWSTTDWKTAWLRLKIDAHFLATDERNRTRVTLIDFKTGQPRPVYDDQGHLYSTAALSLYPKVDIVSVEFWYTDHGIILPKRPMTFASSRASGMRSEWEKRIQPMVAEKKFAPKEGKHCTWCSYSKSKGGPCAKG